MLRKALLIAAWTAVCLYFPQLAVLDPVVKPAIDKVPVKQIDSVSVQPVAFYDGRSCPAEAVCDKKGAPCQTCSPCKCEKCDCDAQVSQGPVWRVVSAPFRAGFWKAGPVRRFVSAPFRWLFRRC